MQTPSDPAFRLLPRRVILGAVGTLPLLRAARGAAAHRITLLHLNDFHSRHGPVDPRALSCQPGVPACFGSSPRLATAIREQRRAAETDGRTVFLLDAGDQFQGSLFYTAHHGAAELAVQHAVGTDVMTLGNHEFDNGPATLARYVDAARFPILAANVDASAEPLLAGKLRPFTVLERGGFRLGVVGLTTQQAQTSSSPGPNIRFNDPEGALAPGIAAARAAGAQLVVLLSHLGLPVDAGLSGPAVIVGGHTHTLLSNDEPGASGPHPTLGAAGSLPRPLIVQAGAYGRYLGRLDLDLADDGRVLAYGGACRHVGADLPDDPEVAAIVARFAAPLEALRQRKVTTLPEPLDAAVCRLGPCAFGTLAAETLRRAARGPSGTAVIGLMNAGGLRVGLPAGPITLGQVLDALPFGNTLATATVSGADLAETARHGLLMTGRGAYAQWAGLRVAGLGFEVQGADGGWGPIDPAGHYLLATNNFVRSGGDGYTALRDRAINAYDSGPNVSDLIAEALAGGAMP